MAGARTCPKCHRDFEAPSRLKRHLQRKTPCAPVVEKEELPISEQTKAHACRFCGRRFEFESGLSRHLKNSCKIAGSREGMEKLVAHVEAVQLRQELAAQREELAEIKALLKVAAAARPAVSQQAHQITNYVGNNVTINVFGEEDTSHITQQQIRSLLDRLLAGLPYDPDKAAVGAFVETAMLIYSDKDRPENLTVYMPNAQNTSVMVYTGQAWEMRELRDVAPPMTQHTLDLLLAQQPWEDGQHKLDEYGALLRSTLERASEFAQGKHLRAVLVRTKRLLR